MVKRLPVHHGLGVRLLRIQLMVYVIGVNFYAPWKWIPSISIGQMDSERFIFKVKRISNTHINGFLFHWIYFCMYLPGKFKWER